MTDTRISHSPGPWHPEEQWCGTAIKTEDEKETVARVSIRYAEPWRELANAWVIAAAPKLYEALVDLISCAETFEEFNDPNHDYYLSLFEARSALAKAEPPSPPAWSSRENWIDE